MNAIDIPAIRACIGGLTYYTATFTFKQIAERVKRAEEELHTSKSLSEQLQRALTSNYESIKDYILTQKEHFFNALVLAVYDGDPTWNELEFEFKGVRCHSLGFLHLNGQEQIFPVDGQHRVEGIKEALKEDPKLGDEKISVIFIGHHNNANGKEKTRRIFSTLNRYAKPVALGDIIALDEDDIVAIVTRDLLEKCTLFINENVKVDKKSSKALSETDDKSFTSLITLYETNKIIYTYYKSTKDNQKKLYNNTKISNLLKFRPNQSEIDDFYNYLMHFWNKFIDVFPGINDFVNHVKSASHYRNKVNGGLLYFRPIALPHLVKSIFETKKRSGIELEECMINYAQLELTISNEPWINFLWDNITKTMIMKYKNFIFHMLIFMYNKALLNKKERSSLIKNYALALKIDEHSSEEKLTGFLEHKIRG